MESIEKLRDWCEETCGTSICGDEINIIADEIEAEIAERYMELPKDADGKPIHIGDRVLEVDGADPDEVTALFLRGYEWQVEGAYICCDADKCKHVKHRTIEDVLEDFGIECDEQYPIRPRAELIAEYADEIRELLGVSE